MKKSIPLDERVYLGVGSNLGNRAFFLERAKALLQKLPGTRFIKSSSVIETEPVGGPPQGKFLNAIWEIKTSLPPEELKTHLQKIEIQIGRKRTVRNAPREIDLDILFYGDRVVEEKELEIPHPRLHERSFVLIPFAEIAPEKIHPRWGKTVRELLEELPVNSS